MKHLDVLAVIHFGNYADEGNGIYKVIDDNCPCCGWTPPAFDKAKSDALEDHYRLGEIWNPRTGKAGMGCFFQVFQCENCGLTYATHLN